MQHLSQNNYSEVKYYIYGYFRPISQEFICRGYIPLVIKHALMLQFGDQHSFAPCFPFELSVKRTNRAGLGAQLTQANKEEP